MKNSENEKRKPELFRHKIGLEIISAPTNLRAILQESEAKLEMKIFNPASFFVWR